MKKFFLFGVFLYLLFMMSCNKDEFTEDNAMQAQKDIATYQDSLDRVNDSINQVNNYIREIYNAKIFQYKHLSIIKIEGNGFLRGQIRIIVDFLLKINDNELSLKDLEMQLKKIKLINKHLAPQSGLYLERVWY